MNKYMKVINNKSTISTLLDAVLHSTQRSVYQSYISVAVFSVPFFADVFNSNQQDSRKKNLCKTFC